MNKIEELLSELRKAAESSTGEIIITPKEMALLDKFVLDKETESEGRKYFRERGAISLPASRYEVLILVARTRLEITDDVPLYEKLLFTPPSSREPNFEQFCQWVACHYLARLEKESLIPAGTARTHMEQALAGAGGKQPSLALYQTIIEELFYLHDEPAILAIVNSIPKLFDVDGEYASRIVDKLDSFYPLWRDKINEETRKKILDNKTMRDIDRAPVTAIHETEDGPSSDSKRLYMLIGGIVIAAVIVALLVYFFAQ